MLFQTVAAMFGGFNPKELLQEVVERMTEEFDYTPRSRNQQYFADRYRGHSFVKIPEIVAGALGDARAHVRASCTARRFYDVLENDTQEQKNRYGEIINRFANGSIAVDGVFSADPHPGNYIFMDDGRICFLDFGLIKRLDRDRASDSCARPGLAILHKDPERARDVPARRSTSSPRDVDVDREPAVGALRA